MLGGIKYVNMTGIALENYYKHNIEKVLIS